MSNDETNAKARSVDDSSLPDPLELPKDVEDMSSEDWTALNRYMAEKLSKLRA